MPPMGGAAPPMLAVSSAAPGSFSISSAMASGEASRWRKANISPTARCVTSGATPEASLTLAIMSSMLADPIFMPARIERD